MGGALSDQGHWARIVWPGLLGHLARDSRGCQGKLGLILWMRSGGVCDKVLQRVCVCAAGAAALGETL